MSNNTLSASMTDTGVGINQASDARSSLRSCSADPHIAEYFRRGSMALWRRKDAMTATDSKTSPDRRMIEGAGVPDLPVPPTGSSYRGPVSRLFRRLGQRGARHG